MDKAVERTIEAVMQRQQILIYGDYDVDGVTSVAVLYSFLRDMGGEVSYHIPDRSSEGYGLTRESIDSALARKTDLLITVDTGITAIDAVRYAREQGIDVIICDHHEPASELPPANAILDPKRKEDTYCFRELAAVGVTYKLAQGISRRLELEEDRLDQYIDLVAIGSSADIVPLIDENRIIVKMGLDKINYDCSIGVEALIRVAGIRKNWLDVNQIVFGMAPRINAVGRLGNAERAVEMLTTRNRNRAVEMARILETENNRRKSIDSQTLKEARQLLKQRFDPATDRAIILYQEGWHPGVIGIVASRLIEQYHRPTIMLTIEKGLAKGSARSIHSFDIFQALKECEDLLEQYGGHKYAAGLSIREENLPEFERRFLEVAKRDLTQGDLVPRLKIDGTLLLDQIDTELLNIIRRFAPFGPRNKPILFASFGVELLKGPRNVGSNHLLVQVGQNGAVFNGIGYNLGPLVERIPASAHFVDIVYTIEENEWQGQVSVQLYLKDIREIDKQPAETA
ncbi:MAG: single-stranded-DNA-specific exonuclease RecJ, partial [Candidatus Delongbacteria bacterium]|nr:single-stranded-DNA-specific exonuclease RecJ [Candidatus Delongbacteria bacterium]